MMLMILKGQSQQVGGESTIAELIECLKIRVS